MTLRSILAIAVALSSTLPAAAESLVLEDCRITAGPAYPGIKARCGTLVRPEDPSRPSGSLLELRVAVVPALSLEPEADPVVPLAGGPGQGAIEFYAANVGAFERIRRNRDIVLLDQRGTGRSARMDCDADDGIVDGRVSSDQTLAAARACLDALPHDPRFFTTSVAITDLEALREALGYREFNLYGGSYGTRVAQHFARRYPGSTRTMILDGVTPPQLALGPGIATEAQKALDAIFARCAESAACAERFPDVGKDFEALRSRLADSPQDVTLPHPVSGRLETVSFGTEQLAASIRLLSYHPNTVALMPFFIHEAANGNYAPLAAQFLMITDNISESLSLGMHNAVVCAEDVPYFDGEAISDEELAATYLGPMMVDTLRTICSIWPKGVVDDGFKTPLKSDIPVLLLSGEADPVTPPWFAELAAVDLSNALLLTGERQGHGQASRGCMPDVMARFVESGTTSGLDTGCLRRQFAMPFFLGFSGPSP